MEYTAPTMATLVSVITLMLTGQPLTPANVFMLIGFMLLLRKSICIHLAYGLLETYEAHASLDRIEQVLLLENLPSSFLNQTANGGSNSDESFPPLKRNTLVDHHEENQDVSFPRKVEEPKNPTTLRVIKLTKKQLDRENECILQDITFTAESGTLTVISGPVGSRKSTLLSAIAGEIPDTSGTISCKGTLVYVRQ